MKKRILLCALLSFYTLCFAQNNTAEKFSQYKKDNLQFRFKDLPEFDEKISLEDIKANQGYYMQNQMMIFQGNPRSNKLFKLSVNKNVFLDEVDVIDSKEVLINRQILEFNSNKLANENYQIKKYQDKIYIFDSKADWNCDWAYQFPFVYVCGLNQLMSCEEALSITSKKLIEFAGVYTFDSCNIIKNSNETNIQEKMKQRIITVEYDGGRKSLVTNVNYYKNHKFKNKGSDYKFTETKTPFFWTFAEGGAGSLEYLMSFYEDGIACYTNEYISNSSHNPEDNGGSAEFYEYSSFYKKDLSKKQPEYSYLTTNLRVRDEPDLENGKSIVTLNENSVVEIVRKGKKVTIDGIEDYWLNIKAKAGTLDKDGNPVSEDVSGWCFGGYLKKIN